MQKWTLYSSMCECYVFALYKGFLHRLYNAVFNTFLLLFIQAILLESPTRQLTLGDIYKWFTTNFKYFRTTSNLTWKVKFTNALLQGA